MSAAGGSVSPSGRSRARLPTAAVMLVLLGACTSQQVFGTGQEWQKQQCRQIPDTAERARCLQSAARSYEDYKTEADKARPR